MGERHTGFNLIYMYMHRNPVKENESMMLVGPKAYTPFEIKNDKLWGCIKAKGVQLGVITCETVTRKYVGKCNGR